MNFVSYAELSKDIILWSESLPRDIDVVAGVARSGIIPATMLALHRNIRLTTVEGLRDGSIFTGGYRDQHTKLKTALVVDDSILSGKSLRQAKAALSGLPMKIHYGGVYIKPNAVNQGWLFHRQMPMPRIFEWNWLHHFWLQKACMDIDGVLCRDPTKQENDDGARYRKFLVTVSPRHIPTVQVHTIVTSRLERYRTETRVWLARQKINYQELVMHPAATARERRAAGDHAERKAKTYNNPEFGLFIESSVKQATEINRLTTKPVLCTDSMELYV